MSRHTPLARARAAATGETHQAAAKAIAALPCGSPIIPEAAPDQAHLETELLLGLRDLNYMGPPFDVPAAITRRAPTRDGLVLQIARPHLTDALTLWLPYTDPDGEFHGVPGLRARHRGHRIELHLLSHEATVTVPASRAQWVWARTHVEAVHTHRGTALWAREPASPTAVEHAVLARRRQRFRRPHRQDWSRLGSAVLRRLGLVTAHHATGFAGHADLWRGLPWARTGASPLHMEWGRPHHVAALAEQLTAPTSPVALPAPLRHSVEHDAKTSTIQIRSALGNELQLRVCPVPGDGPVWEWEEHLPLNGPHRPPHRQGSRLLPATVRGLLIDALAGENIRAVLGGDPLITLRECGGVTVSGLDRVLHPVAFLRFAAQAQSVIGLWPRDLQDVTETLTEDGLRPLVRVRGVDVVLT